LKPKDGRSWNVLSTLSVEETRLIDLITPTLQSMGYELWGYEKQPQGGRQLLRVYIEKEAGVTLEDCAKASRQIGALLVVENPLSNYLLEVSSPGMDRILFTLEQCQRYIGKKISVKLLQTVEQRKRVVGILTEVNEKEIVVQTEDGDIVVQWGNVAKARLVAEYASPQGKKSGFKRRDKGGV
jgi:ribosome maturation factor RimP